VVQELVDGQACSATKRGAVANAEIGTAINDRKLPGAAKPFTPNTGVH
jgi:hypothetical protein